MPNHPILERLIGTALIDRDFRARLLHAPVVAAAGFGLSEEELTLLSTVKAHSLEEFAYHVNAWITRAPNPIRTLRSQRSLDGNEVSRLAV